MGVGRRWGTMYKGVWLMLVMKVRMVMEGWREGVEIHVQNTHVTVHVSGWS